MRDIELDYGGSRGGADYTIRGRVLLCTQKGALLRISLRVLRGRCFKSATENQRSKFWRRGDGLESGGQTVERKTAAGGGRAARNEIRHGTGLLCHYHV